MEDFNINNFDVSELNIVILDDKLKLIENMIEEYNKKERLLPIFLSTTKISTRNSLLKMTLTIRESIYDLISNIVETLLDGHIEIGVPSNLNRKLFLSLPQVSINPIIHNLSLRIITLRGNSHQISDALKKIFPIVNDNFKLGKHKILNYNHDETRITFLIMKGIQSNINLREMVKKLDLEFNPNENTICFSGSIKYVLSNIKKFFQSTETIFVNTEGIYQIKLMLEFKFITYKDVLQTLKGKRNVLLAEKGIIITLQGDFDEVMALLFLIIDFYHIENSFEGIIVNSYDNIHLPLEEKLKKALVVIDSICLSLSEINEDPMKKQTVNIHIIISESVFYEITKNIQDIEQVSGCIVECLRKPLDVY
jgi:hypothetical protein